MKGRFEIILIAIFGIALGFGTNLLLKAGKAPPAAEQVSSSTRTLRDPSRSREISQVLTKPDSQQVTRAFTLVNGFSEPSECLNFASRLLDDPENKDSETLWCLVLARWSELDPQGMIDFVEGQPDSRLRLLAWETWAATDPDLLATKVTSMGPPKSVSVLKGIASQNPDLALEAAFESPDTNSLIWPMFRSSTGFKVETIKRLLQSAAYDGTRNPMMENLTDTLAQRDPKEALSFVQKKGRNWSDPSAKLFAKLAHKNPKQAVDLLGKQPSSRSKAISTVQVAKTWAAQDPEAALAWTRSQSSSQIRDSSLVAIASVIGGEDPDQGLALLDEVGWKDVGLFYAVGTVQPKGKLHDQIEEHDIAMTHRVGRSLLETLAQQDPEAAKKYISTNVPESRRASLLTIFDSTKGE